MKQRGQEYLVFNQPCAVKPEQYDFFFTMLNEYHKPQQIEVTAVLKKEIDQTALQKAADTSLFVFPTFRECRYKKENILYSYYSDRSPRIFCDEATLDRGVLCSRKENPYQFRISYEKHLIRVRVDHALTDGHGLLRYVNTLLYYYLLYLGEPVMPDASVTLLETPISEDEFINLTVLHDEKYRQYNEEMTKREPQKSLMPFLSVAEESESYHRTEIHFPSEQLLKLSKRTESSPVSVMLPFYAQALMRLSGNPENLPVVCSSPIDMRNIYHKKTMRNASRILMLKYYPDMMKHSLDLQGTMIRGQIDLALNYPERIPAEHEPKMLMSVLSRIPMMNKRTIIFPFLSSLGKIQMSPSMTECIDDVKFDAFISVMPSYTGFITYKDDVCMFCDHKYGSDGIFTSLIQVLEENGITPQYNECGVRQYSAELFE